jgi:hypothetical protein
MSEWTENELVMLRKLILKAEEDPEFSIADIANLKTMADAFKGFQYLGRFAKYVVFSLAALAGFLTAYETIAAKARAWFAG